jgi:flavin reductase (DIM6/NTAB) family NADH-FMN oxidoreductase RutF
MRLIETASLTGRQRYELLTSLVVPRPIGWISTWGEGRVANLAPFSYFAALSASPMLVGASIGNRRHGPKDTLLNIRRQRAFCTNVVAEPLLEAMNATSADVAPDVDEFALTGLTAAQADRVDAPYVKEAPAVFECALRQEVSLEDAPNTLVIAEVVGVRLSDDLALEEGTLRALPEALAPVGRLGGPAYALPGEVRRLPRPGR